MGWHQFPLPPPISFYKHTYTLTLFGLKGRNCERCQSLFYREVGTLLWAKDVCKPCECHSAGTANGSLECEPVSVDMDTKKRIIHTLSTKIVALLIKRPAAQKAYIDPPSFTKFIPRFLHIYINLLL